MTQILRQGVVFLVALENGTLPMTAGGEKLPGAAGSPEQKV